ncbi:uncharacterized protein LOC144643151 [Oculina patagonica]
MWIKAELLAFVFSWAFFACVFSCMDPAFLGVNLLEKNNTSTRKPCQPRGRGEPPPLPVSIAWQDKPPYIYEERGPKPEQEPEMLSRKAREVANESEDNQEKGRLRSEENFKGIFYEIVNKGLQICDAVPPEGANFTTKADDLKQLDQSIVKKEADIAMPVYGSEDGKYGGYEYVEILKSPGVVFIVNKEQTREHLRNRVVQAMKDTWPVIVITLLLTGFAGLFVWGLDTSRNSDHFPRSFTRGVMEGIWWSFVSMTTVGYGDRVPKSLLARLFGVLWILTGIVLCSFFTATFTSALTSSSIKQRESLLGVKVAVMADSYAYDEALKHAANVKDFPDFYEMYDALVHTGEVEGILADIYTASYYMEKISDSRLVVSMFFSSQRSIGFVTGRENKHLKGKVECLRNLFKYRQRDIKKIILRHTQTFHTQTQNWLTNGNADDILTLLDGESSWFKSTFHALLVTFLLILTMGFAYESCIAKLRTTPTTPDSCNSINLATESPTCKPNR